MKITPSAMSATAALSAATALVLALVFAYRRVRSRHQADHFHHNQHQRRKSYWDNRPEEEKLRIRRERILSKPVVVTKPSGSRNVSESTDSLSSAEDARLSASSSSDDANGQPGTRNLKLYHYYDVEIKGRELQAKDYEKSPYHGYSSYNPSPIADGAYFTQAEVNVKRLGDWNRRFQDSIAHLRTFSPSTALPDRIETNLNLLHLAQDFIYAATTYGKIIISEYYLPFDKKTIKPCSLPGLMGGQKYVVHNILFKFAVDYNELFGNDYSAAKAAGNELRGLISYFNCGIKELNVPLMALVDYRGFRLIALSILPVTPDTIIYGSCDAGRNIHATNEVFNEKMEHAAKILNLKPHKVRLVHATQAPHPIDSSSTALVGGKAQFNQTESPVVFAKYQAKIAKEELHGSGDLSASNGSVVIHGSDPPSLASSTASTTPPSTNTSGHIRVEQMSNADFLRTASHLYLTPASATAGSDDDGGGAARSADEESEEEGEVQLLWSPADLEGHQGRDGKFYLLDFSRVLPPETPNKNFKNAHLSRLLRPEFVQAYSRPLCSDAFSGFIRGDPNEYEHNQEIREATQHLLTVLIPKFANTLNKMLQDARDQGRLHEFRLTETIHTVGINSRHIGLLRCRIEDEEFKELILAEIIARAIKNNLRFKLREMMKQLKLPLEEPYRRLVIDYLNLVFGATKESDAYWDNWLKSDLQMNFENALSEEESKPDFHLKVRVPAPQKHKDGHDEAPGRSSSIKLMTAAGALAKNQVVASSQQNIKQEFIAQVFERVTNMMGLEFVSRTFMFSAEKPFDDTDLLSIGERVKHMNIIAHAQGFFYHITGLACRVEDPTSAKKFYEIAISKFEEALDSNPNNKEILLSITLTYVLSIEEDFKNVPNAKFSPDDPRVRKAEEYALRAISAEPKYDSWSLFRYAQFLERCGRLESAEDYYLLALEADSNNTGALHCYGDFLSDQGFDEEAEKFYLRSSKTTEGYKYRPDYYY